MLISSKWSLSFRFPSKRYVNCIPQFFFLFRFFTPLAHPILLDVITLTVYDEKYKSRNPPVV